MDHPRDRFLTVFGRKPVLEALEDPRLQVDKVVLAHNAAGESVEQIVSAANRRGISVERASPGQVNRLSRSAQQDQGAVADIRAPRMAALQTWLTDKDTREARRGARLLLLDGITTPANVGMILRVATAAGLEGVILPRLGCPEVGPLVVKASAGVAFFAPILRVATPREACDLLLDAGFDLVSLRMDASESLYEAEWRGPVCFVLGNETRGVSPTVSALVTRGCRVPMEGGVESLNVATAAAVVSFELMRRKLLAPPPRSAPRNAPQNTPRPRR